MGLHLRIPKASTALFVWVRRGDWPGCHHGLAPPTSTHHHRHSAFRAAGSRLSSWRNHFGALILFWNAHWHCLAALVRAKDAAMKCQAEDIGASVHRCRTTVVGTLSWGCLRRSTCGTRSPKKRASESSRHAALSTSILLPRRRSIIHPSVVQVVKRNSPFFFLATCTLPFFFFFFRIHFSAPWVQNPT
jgi:hypothetical protein